MSTPAYLIVEMKIGDYRPHSRVRALRLGATDYFNMVLVEGIAAPV